MWRTCSRPGWWCGGRIAATEIDRDAEPARPGAQHVDVAEDRQPARQRVLRQGDAQVRPDSRGFACRQGEVG